MVCNDKIGQTPVKFDNVIYNIFKVVCCMNGHKGNTFILATYNSIKLQSIRGCLFMVSPCVIPCYNIISFKNSVRTQDDNFSGFNRLIETFIKKLLGIKSG